MRGYVVLALPRRIWPEANPPMMRRNGHVTFRGREVSYDRRQLDWLDWLTLLLQLVRNEHDWTH